MSGGDDPSGGVDSSAAGRPVTAPTPRTPVRTCVGCRGRGGRADLVRVVVVEGVLVPDPRARLAGRGAWVHPDPACLDLAVRRRAFARALRSDVSPDVTAVRAEIDRRTGAPSVPPA
ncbi:MAG: YlxR family protein [Candidatus Nanopelagicales bacterium]